jgi:polyhydroxyalkanoate synthesis regulator phasin
MPPKIPTIPTPTIGPGPDWQRMLETGMQFTELRRSQARAIVSDLVAQGHLARDQMSAAVDEVIDISRRRSDDLRKVVQSEVQRQLGALGLATRADLNALERRLTRANREARKAGPAKKASATKKAAPAKKKAASKTTPKAG